MGRGKLKELQPEGADPPQMELGLEKVVLSPEEVRAGLAVEGASRIGFCDCAAPIFRGGYQKLVRYVTDEQRSCRPIFIATLWAGLVGCFPRGSLDPYDSDMGALPPVRLGPPLKTAS